MCEDQRVQSLLQLFLWPLCVTIALCSIYRVSVPLHACTWMQTQSNPQYLCGLTLIPASAKTAQACSALCTNRCWQNVLSWTSDEKHDPTSYQPRPSKPRPPLQTAWLTARCHSNPGFSDVSPGDPSPSPLGVFPNVPAPRNDSIALLMRGRRSRTGCGSLREENEERLTSEFVTALFLMAL